MREWIWLVLKMRGRYDEDWTLKRHQRLWATTRCLVALVLRREGDSDYGPELANTLPVRWQHPEYGSAADWTVIKVTRRLRDGLLYELVETGYP